jgi:hypothetical protein
LQALSQFRNAIRDSAEARAAFNANPGNSDLASQAKVAAEAVKTAAAKTRADLLDAYEAARRSAQSISRSVEDLQTSFLQNRTGGQGITRFLSGQALYDTQQATFRSLLPLFEQARAQQSRQFAAEGNFYASAQIAGLNFSGSTAGVNQAMLDFIAAARNDSRIQQDLYTSQVDLARASRDLLLINDLLAKSNAELATAIPTLTTAVSTLAVKDWSVQISVASDGSSAAYGDVLNGAVTQ